MIREMKPGEEDAIRNLLAKSDYFEDLLTENKAIKISKEVVAKNVIFVAESNGAIVGFCWCSISDNGLSKVGEIVEFYVMPEHRRLGIGVNLLKAATDLFGEERVVAFAWTERQSTAAIEAYKKAGFEKYQEPVFYFVP